MARYDGLIIPRSYSEYINKTDAATLSQALQLNNVMDDTPTEDSVKPIKSGGVYDALASKQPTLTFDDVPTDASDNPVKSNGIYDALATKQDTLTFDNTPTAGSDNPVKSGGIKTALNGLIQKQEINIEMPSATNTGAVGNRFYQLIKELSDYGLTIDRVVGIVITDISNSQIFQIYPFLYNEKVYVNFYSQSANQIVTGYVGKIKLLFV